MLVNMIHEKERKEEKQGSEGIMPERKVNAYRYTYLDMVNKEEAGNIEANQERFEAK